MITVIKGMRDLLPPESGWFAQLEAAAREVFAQYGFAEIRTPILERTELFTRSVGEETDIVGKEMYTFADRDQTSLTLRPEATAAVARAYVEHRLWEQPGLSRLFYMGPMFRRERPQKGRYRQFFQMGAEVLGGDAPQIDYELLEMLALLLDRIGLAGWTLKLNSVGCAGDRERYQQALRAALAPVKDRMCADCQRRAETNPLRVLDCKHPEDQPIIAALPALRDSLDEACREHFEQLQKLLMAGGIEYQLEPRLVRGLDYYTRTAFEFQHGSLGAQNALLGGGRYDQLAERLGAPRGSGAGIGFAIGLDRLVSVWRELTAPAPAPSDAAAPSSAAPRSGIYLAPLEEPALIPALELARQLRQAGAGKRQPEAAAAIVVGAAAMAAKKHLQLASRSHFRWVVLLGEREIASRELTIKDLASGDQISRAWDPAALLRELQ